ncbi:MAG: hypothetical protein K0R29_2790 [Pseudobdellovibrio sp.]|nr:hypothetical protein [Pseudobdellovibrio sp.]
MGQISCKAPWVGLAVRSDNTIAACSSSSFSTTLEGVSSLSQAVNIEALKTYRTNHFTESPLDSCHVCTKRNAVDVRSLRNVFNDLPDAIKTESGIGTVDPSRIVLLDLNLSTQCNLKCRMCSAVRSSGWQSDQSFLASQLNFVAPPPRETPVELDLDLEKFPRLRFVILKGGEPLFDKTALNFMERMVQSGLSKNVTLTIYTNGIFAKKKLEILSQFKKLNLIFSFEATGGLYSYIRGGAYRFDSFTETLKAFQHLENIHISFMYTPQAYNVFDLPDAADFIIETANPLLNHKLALKDVQTSFSNILIDPAYLGIDVLPDSVRQEALKRLKSRKHRMEINWSGIEQLLTKPQNKDGYEKFLKFTKLLDQRRSENVLEAIPAFAESEIALDIKKVSVGT